MRIDVPPKSKRKFTPRLKVWKLKDPQTSNHFQEVFNLHVSTSAGVADGATEDNWNNIKTGLLKTTEEVCGTTLPHRCHRETWWWNEHVEKVIAAKRRVFKAWKAGKGTRASYDAAKRNARHAVHHARQDADKKVYENIDPKSSEVYRLANQFRRENTDVVGDKPVKNDAGEMSVSEDSKQKAWLEHYQRLLNVEFDWDPDHLSYQLPVEGPPIPITIDTVKKAISQNEGWQSTRPIRHSGGDDTSRRWHGSCIYSWWQGTLWLGAEFHCLPLQGKGGCIGKGQLPRSQADRAGYENPGEDCGWPHQTVGVNQRVPVGLRPRQRHYRCNLCCQAAAREVSSCQQETLHAFIDLEKVFDRVPWKVIWWALRKLGVEEWIVRLVQGMYAYARSHVHVGEGYSEEFEVKVGVHQGSVLSLLLLIIVLEALSREFRSGVPWEDLYADDLVIIAESLDECVRKLLTWKEAMEKKILRVNAGKTKIMICGMGLDHLQSSGEFPCALCHTGVGSNSIFCNGCKHSVNKKCSGLKRLTKDPDYRCTRCQGTARPWMADHRRKSRSDLTSLRW